MRSNDSFRKRHLRCIYGICHAVSRNSDDKIVWGVYGGPEIHWYYRILLLLFLKAQQAAIKEGQ